jgi:hypothetical protein
MHVNRWWIQEPNAEEESGWRLYCEFTGDYAGRTAVWWALPAYLAQPAWGEQ